jgi:hypothetical protein
MRMQPGDGPITLLLPPVLIPRAFLCGKLCFVICLILAALNNFTVTLIENEPDLRAVEGPPISDETVDLFLG